MSPGTLRWLTASRSNDPRKLEYALSGPLYAASIIFERHTLDSHARVSAAAQAKLPFGKKYSASIVADSAATEQSVGFSIHRETVNGVEKRWTQTPEGLVRSAEGGRPFVISQRLVSLLGAPIISAADLLFRVDETWRAETSLAGVYFVAGHRLLGLRLERTGRDLIDGVVTAASLVESPGDPMQRFLELPWDDGRKFQFVWSESLRKVTAVRAQVPLLGRVDARLSGG